MSSFWDWKRREVVETLLCADQKDGLDYYTDFSMLIYVFVSRSWVCDI